MSAFDPKRTLRRLFMPHTNYRFATALALLLLGGCASHVAIDSVKADNHPLPKKIYFVVDDGYDGHLSDKMIPKLSAELNACGVGSAFYDIEAEAVEKPDGTLEYDSPEIRKR